MWRVVKTKNVFRLQWNRWIIFRTHYIKEPLWLRNIPEGYYNTDTLLSLLLEGKKNMIRQYRQWRVKPNLNFLNKIIKHLESFSKS